jgi:hypothetical protein
MYENIIGTRELFKASIPDPPTKHGHEQTQQQRNWTPSGPSYDYPTLMFSVCTF